ncbi:acyltransferase 3 [Thraustotheca clavata]|uniref:Acyltransferase 3 n=1 Tax=Thraustotheca clavata TaxID=74557 RepID=A0A1W0A2T1_9STRA|nr:acyltransferase 3 [Thraustotheca clavata]
MTAHDASVDDHGKSTDMYMLLADDKEVPKPANNSYRSDIDGLRALAVLPVVVFHAYPEEFPGGFIGVDIFFVISGYLISGILFKEFQKEKFTYSGFYARRVRRIFPTLILVLSATLWMGYLYLMAPKLKALAATMLAGTLFCANLQVLSLQHSYFDIDIKTNPLLHLWSLGVEEQFYIFWPFFVSIIAKMSYHRGIIIQLTVLFLSFFINISFLGVHDSNKISFYMPLSRFWQMSMGGLLAYIAKYHDTNNDGFFHEISKIVSSIRDNYRCNILSIFGVVLILAGFASINESRMFPGFWAVLPTLGATCIIAAGPQAFINANVLSNPLANYIGKISYCLYLWHWPILVFAKEIYPMPSSRPFFMAPYSMLLVSFILSIITYNEIEKPVRWCKSKYVLPSLVICMITLAILAGCAYKNPSDFSMIEIDLKRSVAEDVFDYDGIPAKIDSQPVSAQIPESWTSDTKDPDAAPEFHQVNTSKNHEDDEADTSRSEAKTHDDTQVDESNLSTKDNKATPQPPPKSRSPSIKKSYAPTHHIPPQTTKKIPTPSPQLDTKSEEVNSTNKAVINEDDDDLTFDEEDESLDDDDDTMPDVYWQIGENTAESPVDPWSSQDTPTPTVEIVHRFPRPAVPVEKNEIQKATKSVITTQKTQTVIPPEARPSLLTKVPPETPLPTSLGPKSPLSTFLPPETLPPTNQPSNTAAPTSLAPKRKQKSNKDFTTAPMESNDHESNEKSADKVDDIVGGKITTNKSDVSATPEYTNIATTASVPQTIPIPVKKIPITNTSTSNSSKVVATTYKPTPKATLQPEQTVVHNDTPATTTIDAVPTTPPPKIKEKISTTMPETIAPTLPTKTKDATSVTTMAMALHSTTDIDWDKEIGVKCPETSPYITKAKLSTPFPFAGDRNSPYYPEKCLILNPNNEKNGLLIVLGDSHADMSKPRFTKLHEAAVKENKPFPTILFKTRFGRAILPCRPEFFENFEMVKAVKPQVVLLVVHFMQYLNPGAPEDRLKVSPPQCCQLEFQKCKEQNMADVNEILTEFQTHISELVSLGIKVFVVDQGPETYWQNPDTWINGGKVVVPKFVSRAQFAKEYKWLYDPLHAAVAGANATLIDYVDNYSDGDKCLLTNPDGWPVMAYMNHLSVHTARNYLTILDQYSKVMASSPITILESSHLGYLKPYEIYVESNNRDIYSNAWRQDKNHNPKDDFEQALRDGDVVDFFTAHHAGVLVSTGVLGFVTTILSIVAAPESNQFAFMNLGCYIRIILALVSDSIPFIRYKRKSYMILGWLLTVLGLMFASCLDNESALFGLNLSTASIGCVLTKVASDGMMVEFAQRENIEYRGGTQITFIAMHWFGASLGSLALAFLTEDPTGDDSYIWALNSSSILRILSVVSLLPIPAILFFVKDSTLVPAFEFRRRCYMLWRFFQNRALWQVALFQVLSSCFFSLSSVALGYSPLLWFNTPYPWVIHMVFFVIFIYALLFYRCRGLTWTWKRVFVIAGISNFFLQLLMIVFTDPYLNKVSSGLAYAVVWVSAIPTALQYIIRCFPMVEVAAYGYEATTIAILASCGDAFHPFIMLLHQHLRVDGHLSTKSLFIALPLSLLGFFSILFLPSQRIECMTLRHFGGLSRGPAILLSLALTIVPVVMCVVGFPGNSISRI